MQSKRKLIMLVFKCKLLVTKDLCCLYPARQPVIVKHFCCMEKQKWHFDNSFCVPRGKRVFIRVSSKTRMGKWWQNSHLTWSVKGATWLDWHIASRFLEQSIQNPLLKNQSGGFCRSLLIYSRQFNYLFIAS